MTSAVFAIPGDINLRTGGYGYDRAILARLPALGIATTHCGLPGTFPNPSEADIGESVKLLCAAAPNDVLLIDGLAFGVMPAHALARVPQRIIALVHHPLGLEAGLSLERQMYLIRHEIEALKFADHIVVTSAITAKTLVEDFAVPVNAITIAEPGTDRAPRNRRRTFAGEQIELLCVGSVIPRKGYDVLVSALSGLVHLNWHVTLVGNCERDRGTFEALQKQIQKLKLTDRISLVGEYSPQQLEPAYQCADVFVSSSLYEGYGMVLGEAMVRGLPVLTTTGGAAAQTVPDGAGLKVPPNDVGALRHALQRLILESDLRASLAQAAWQAGQTLPSWDDAAGKIADTIKLVAAGMSHKEKTS